MRWTIVKDGKKYYTYEGAQEEIRKMNECTINKIAYVTVHRRFNAYKRAKFGIEEIEFEGKKYVVLPGEVLCKVWIHDGHWITFRKKGYLD